MPQPERVVLVGWGAIGRTAGRLAADEPVDIVGVAVRDRAAPRADLPAGAVVIDDPVDLTALDPQVVAEAAGRDTVGPWCRAAFDCGADFIVSSVSALADVDLATELRDRAAASGCRLMVQSGAVAGIEALAAARLLGLDQVEHRIVKPPRAWAGTPAENLCDLDALTGETVFFEANASETADAFPKNANVAMTTALAGVGPDETRISLVADPAATTNRHELRANGAFGSLEVSIANDPLPDNPKTSALAALSLVRALANRSASFVI